MLLLCQLPRSLLFLSSLLIFFAVCWRSGKLFFSLKGKKKKKIFLVWRTRAPCRAPGNVNTTTVALSVAAGSEAVLYCLARPVKLSFGVHLRCQQHTRSVPAAPEHCLSVASQHDHVPLHRRRRRRRQYHAVLEQPGRHGGCSYVVLDGPEEARQSFHHQQRQQQRCCYSDVQTAKTAAAAAAAKTATVYAQTCHRSVIFPAERDATGRPQQVAP